MFFIFIGCNCDGDRSAASGCLRSASLPETGEERNSRTSSRANNHHTVRLSRREAASFNTHIEHRISNTLPFDVRCSVFNFDVRLAGFMKVDRAPRYRTLPPAAGVPMGKPTSVRATRDGPESLTEVNQEK